MRFKDHVIVMFNPTINRIIDGWEQACDEIISMTYEPTCTSGMDGEHSLESGHYYGRALDFRSRDIPFELRQPLKLRAQEIYGSDYLVILESNHYHVQRNKNTF